MLHLFIVAILIATVNFATPGQEDRSCQSQTFTCLLQAQSSNGRVGIEKPLFITIRSLNSNLSTGQLRDDRESMSQIESMYESEVVNRRSQENQYCEIKVRKTSFILLLY